MRSLRKVQRLVHVILLLSSLSFCILITYAFLSGERHAETPNRTLGIAMLISLALPFVSLLFGSFLDKLRLHRIHMEFGYPCCAPTEGVWAEEDKMGRCPKCDKEWRVSCQWQRKYQFMSSFSWLIDPLFCEHVYVCSCTIPADYFFKESTENLCSQTL